MEWPRLGVLTVINLRMPLYVSLFKDVKTDEDLMNHIKEKTNRHQAKSNYYFTDKASNK